MFGDALATYGSALLILVVSAGLGAGIQALCGARRFSSASPALGFAAALVLAWWTIRLPGEGVTALVVLLLLAGAGGLYGARHLEDTPSRQAALTALLGIAITSIPFLVEGHFGILGTGFNVDMSQHLFAAEWLQEQSGSAPGMYGQGYPLGPHALAAATEALTGNLALSFTGLTVAVPLLVALAVLDCFGTGDRRAIPLALLTAFAYLLASWYAQGSFKELIEVVLLLGLVAWLRSAATKSSHSPTHRALSAVPVVVLLGGSLYVYSGPGLAWPVATLIAWAAIELLVDRERAIRAMRGLLTPILVALVAFLLILVPELGRIVEFGGAVDTVTERGAATRSLTGPATAVQPEEPEYDDSLGNLFGQINPLQVFGVWPSGDFRVLPGDGAVPAPAFWLGALLGLFVFANGLRRLGRESDTVLAAAVLAAATIWVAARIGSTPYMAGKALQILAAPVMLISLLGIVAAFGGAGGREARRPSAPSVGPRLLGLAFLVAAALSSGLALANAPVGPTDYSSALRSLAPRFTGVPTQLLVPPAELAERHGRDFYGWELRGARPGCVDAIPSVASSPPPGIRLVLVIGDAKPPYTGLVRRGERGDVVVWEVERPESPDRLLVDPESPTVCTSG